ncbi:hypothetical protein [Paramaledivibacter caminithermalis]|jgi:hypothetical protein|uniref:Uncharacterized protein n=1 Tax=Paramaledivibacter caminithermalis (strain DSM 15212 / CIP 107654 / DViRD3) TaxID=1121301 RepID=A0A1M6MDG2_PARC5|nr:hypothetical protein [Paramaledivibacter caminithermalis]SHJ81459.1 hypothetical protein SAMN02745912_01178 [Paramaledivibacter caminithermalis DSM 15212]
MNDKELDKKLQIAKNQSKIFFDKFNFDTSKKIVHKRIDANRHVKRNPFGKYLTNRIWRKGAVIICAITLILIVTNQIDNNRFMNKANLLLQQAVELDDDQDSYLVNYFRVDNPNNNNNLLAILWQKNSKGNYEIIYSSMMENTDIPNPVDVINATEGKYALVSSSNKQENFIHYRLVKYSNNSVKAYLEENYVPEGKIKVCNGMLIEERTIPKNYYSNYNNRSMDKFNRVYRYFIPVELRSDGSFALTTSKVKLKKGGTLTLILDDKTVPLEFEYNNDVLNRTDNKLEPNETIQAYINFEAKETGFSNLKIKQKNNIQKENELFIEIVDY